MSVITIFYNAADYLAEAVESVLAQDFDGFELLLVDDGSDDGSSEIARGFASSEHGRVRYFQHAGRQNRGMSASRNLGIEHARGELIAFIDADDRWHPEKLREQVALLDRFPQVAAIFGTVNYWRSWSGGADRLVKTGHVQDVPVAPAEASLALYPLGRAPAPCPSDMMVRRSVARALGGFEESFTGPLQMYEDQAFLAKLYLSETVYFAGQCWLDYRIHDKSCVAEVLRNGQYDSVRKFFLDWLSNYLDTFGGDVPRPVRLRLMLAQLPYCVPGLRQNVRSLTKHLRRILGAAAAHA